MGFNEVHPYSWGPGPMSLHLYSSLAGADRVVERKSSGFPKWIPSLKLTYPLKIGLPKRKVVFQPSILKGYVSFREGIGFELILYSLRLPHLNIVLDVFKGDFLQICTIVNHHRSTT